MTERINHPFHYNTGNIEVIDAIEDWGFGEGFNRGNAIKYIARAARKDPTKEIEDLEKAAWYINREVERLQKEALKNALEPKSVVAKSLEIVAAKSLHTIEV